MQPMTDDEARAFLLEGTRTGKLATVRADGRPHVAPVWFLLDGEDVVFTTWHDTVKAANLSADPRASLCVDDEQPPFAFVIVEGTVSIERAPDRAEHLRWATEIARRYMGDEVAEAYGRRNAVEGEWLLRLTPTKIVAQKDIAG